MELKTEEQLRSMTAEELNKEFDRVTDLCDQAQDAMAAIREEKNRRRDEELERLRAELKRR